MTATATATEDGFRTALDAAPDDWNLRLVYADWLEENGNPDLAATQRWMVKHGRLPLLTSSCHREWLRSWDWRLTHSPSHFRSQHPSLLPPEVFSRLSLDHRNVRGSFYREHRTLADAEQALADALKAAGEI